VQNNLASFLAEHPETSWDAAVLIHSSWYLPNPDSLRDIFSVLRGHTRRILLAEYALTAGGGRLAALPHVLAAMTRGALEASRPEGPSDQPNICTPLGPDAIRQAAKAVGWKVEREDILVPEDGLHDGLWETGEVFSKGFLDEIDAGGASDKVKSMLRSMREAVVASVDQVGGVSKVQTMDVWAVSFVEDVDSVQEQ
jgi:hypothetical protein